MLAMQRAMGYMCSSRQVPDAVRDGVWAIGHFSNLFPQGVDGLNVNAPLFQQARFRRTRGGKAKNKARKMLKAQANKEREEDRRMRAAHHMPQVDVRVRAAPPAPPPRLKPGVE
mmetsp:Transcript_8863/g.12514  ORF Transcript_8863/g.12514 Transcript_8863/m.12514 type:complete len:114 (-) Transcript_8863:8-349(-)